MRVRGKNLQIPIDRSGLLIPLLLFFTGPLGRSEVTITNKWMTESSTTTSIPDIKVRKQSTGEEITLKQIENNWPKGKDWWAMREMGNLKDPRAVKFLCRVAVIDPSLFKERKPDIQEIEQAIQLLEKIHTSDAGQALVLILNAPLESLSGNDRLSVENIAARALLGFDGIDHEKAYKILSENAELGNLLCPFPLAYADQGQWHGPPVLELTAQKLLRQWLSSSNLLIRLKAANCAAQANLENGRTFELAKEQTQSRQFASDPMDREEKIYAEQILYWHAQRGNKKASELLSNLQRQGLY